MAVIGIGLDIVPVERVEKLLERYGDRAMHKLFTAGERALAFSKAYPGTHLAARIAAKEAAYKALSGDEDSRGIGWKEIEVESLEDGRPVLRFHGKAAARFAALGATRSHVSLTHAGGVAAAVVILE